LETPGGGGFGPASARDPSCIAQDVRLGYVTAAAADVAYGKAWREATQ
jgi:N-methylhydantoinase B